MSKTEKPSAKKAAKPAAPASAGLAAKWKTTPATHDYPAAASYLSLITDAERVSDLVERLKKAPVVTHKAKDILRGGKLDLLKMDNPHVKEDLRKIAQGIALSPVLIVRGDMFSGLPLQIADGYHRVCASYHLDENTDIPARIINLV